MGEVRSTAGTYPPFKRGLPSAEPGAADEPLGRLQSALVWEAAGLDLRFTVLGGAEEEMLGAVDPAAREVVRLLERHVSPDDWRGLLETIQRVAAHGGVHQCEHRLVRADGRELWVLSSMQQSGRADGALAVTGVSVDITAHKARETELRSANEQARLLVQNLREYGVFILTLDGRVGGWNPGAQRLKGYAAEEIMGSPLSRFFEADQVERKTPERLLETARLEQHAEYEGWLVRKDGSKFWAGLTVNAVADEAGQLRGFSNVSHDLTQRKHTEELIRQREEQLRRLVEGVQDYGMFTVSPAGSVETWNRGSQRLAGYRVHEIVGAPLARLFPPEELDKRTPAQLLEEAETRGKAAFEGWLVGKNDRRFWGQLTLSAMEDEQGVLRGYSTVARDLSERKRVEDALRTSEERMRLLLDSLRDHAIFMLSPEGSVESCNAGAELLDGYRPEDILGAPLARFFPADQIADGTPGRLLERAASEGRAEYEGWILRASGARLWVSFILSAVRDADRRLRGISLIARDLTDRMMSERAQAFSSDMGTALAGALDLATVLRAIGRLATRELAVAALVLMRDREELDPVFVMHADAEKQRRLEAALHRMPYDAKSSRGICGVLQSGQPEIMPNIAETGWLGAILAEGGDEGLLRCLATRAYICVPLTARGDTFGAIVLIAAAGVPYGRRELAVAEELARHAALAIDNARLHEEAQTAIRLREEILAIVSHDLRNPLGTVQMGARQLATQPPGEDTKKIAERMVRASERMNHMIRDLLDFSSVSGGRLRLELGSHEPRRLVEEVLEALAPQATSAGITLEKRIEVDGPVRCDFERIQQVLTNLVTNAIRFAPQGSLVTVSSGRDGEQVVFSVSDRGPGIDESDVPHVFERYWRGKTQGRESLGLGLAIARGIVESHGGKIWVESRRGAGATFFFSLPRAP